MQVVQGVKVVQWGRMVQRVRLVQEVRMVQGTRTVQVVTAKKSSQVRYPKVVQQHSSGHSMGVHTIGRASVFTFCYHTGCIQAVFYTCNYKPPTHFAIVKRTLNFYKLTQSVSK